MLSKQLTGLVFFNMSCFGDLDSVGCPFDKLKVRSLITEICQCPGAMFTQTKNITGTPVLSGWGATQTPPAGQPMIYRFRTMIFQKF